MNVGLCVRLARVVRGVGTARQEVRSTFRILVARREGNLCTSALVMGALVCDGPGTGEDPVAACYRTVNVHKYRSPSSDSRGPVA